VPQRWAVYFSKNLGQTAGKRYSLKVFGYGMADPTKPSLVWDPAAVDVDLDDKERFEEPAIAWPDTNETDLCASNFCPYGTYTIPGTITATLTSGSTSVPLSSLYQDTGAFFWSVQFNSPPDLTLTYTLAVTLTPTDTTQKPSTATRTGLKFVDC
jgi:hypothetical protein